MANMETRRLLSQARSLTEGLEENLRDRIVTALYARAEGIAARVIKKNPSPRRDWDRRLDTVLTSRLWGYPLMLILLAAVFWLTVSGANYPSALLGRLLFGFQDILSGLFGRLGAPDWLHGILVLGMYRTLAWVVSVMLPPMAIFFPLFTLLEDLGYLPRVAFNLDHLFHRAGAHGKQALTMCMGFGCNAAGVVGCRIIESPRERLIAILTNNFAPCNGRFPTLIALATIFLGGLVAPSGRAAVAALSVAGIVLLGILLMFLTSWLLSRTILKGVPSAFTLELPPYRPPQVLRVIVRSVFDRTLFVLARAVVVAAPAGALTWALANIHVGGVSIIAHLAGWLQPLGRVVGLDGYILLAFILGLPANEIVIPILLMGYLATGMLTDLDSLAALGSVLTSHGWTTVTALNMMLFSLLHWPCTTTLLTIYKETKGLKWPLLAALIPTAMGLLACFLVKTLANLAGLF
ncbi:iron transporter FeoB [Moorella thermoacetica]|uniref:Nucleoside recognition n=1 Tax=Moorella thermoacetica (strain ATCC 39073 / JCM 9320) TaxID=264732 RepID=Q2RIM1_MOOTA|nr:nucleoside recognition domain-containing protein [Moorella thermoacetica]AKX94188.1 ferrous iron transport protein B [Moorella thermoacetica]AKX96827.1 ferrous iron transport protein B [Moorella thermoacetica]OIQ57997.1 ferrous iron transport protein B [Moorella thermoacetica]QDA00639.1 Ferrous iron transport protein B [Moorella thermoacetica]TYL11551.1 Fe(2+) transporter FeoB [Moorella thermoacetica]